MFNLKFIIEDPVVLYALIIIVIAFAYQIFHLIYLRKKFARCKTTYSADASYELPPVSVVLCLRDDYSTLKSDIPILLNQEYPDYEIVIVNFSTNATYAEKIDTWSKQNSKLTVVRINQSDNFNCSKVYPLALGIKSARNDIILLTDSNCRPTSIHWIRSMVSKYSQSHTNVAGISNYEKRGSFANKFMRYEMALYNINLFSYLKAVGNYHVDTKNFMFNKKDFLSQKDLPSFFTVSNDGSAILSRLANKAQTGTMINDYAQIQDNRQYSFGAWFATVSSRYSNYKFIKPLPKFVKGLFVTTTFLFVLMAIWFMYYTGFNLLIGIFCLLLSLVRIAVWFITTKKSLVDIGQKDLNFDIVLYDFILTFFRPALYVSASIRHNKLWS